MWNIPSAVGILSMNVEASRASGKRDGHEILGVRTIEVGSDRPSRSSVSTCASKAQTP